MKILTILFICIASSTFGQGENFEKYAVALSEMTTYADNKGFMEEVLLKEDVKVNWQSKNGYTFTTELEYITYGILGFLKKEITEKTGDPKLTC